MDLTDKLAPEPRAAKDVAPFLKQLRAMLDHEHPSVLRWTSNGRAFEIVDMEQMMTLVLPKYFKHRKYTSFQRQLNYFNFRKWTKSKATLCTFSNEFFRRDQPELAWRITRKKSAHNINGHQQLVSPRSELSVHSPASPTPDSNVTIQETNKRQVTVAINLSAAMSDDGMFESSSRSPTDVDLILMAQEFSSCEIEPTSLSAPPLELLESFEWIDVLLPVVEQSGCALQRQAIVYSQHSTSSPPGDQCYEYVAL